MSQAIVSELREAALELCDEGAPTCLYGRAADTIEARDRVIADLKAELEVLADHFHHGWASEMPRHQAIREVEHRAQRLLARIAQG